MKISLVTAVYNRCDTIEDALNSVASQSYDNIEHVIIDGASTDGTLALVNKYASENISIISEKDEGIYDALNKGIAHSTGDVVGLLHSDDIFAHKDVLLHVSRCFSDSSVDAVFGDLQYVAQRDTTRVIRHWKSSPFSRSRLSRGWMPPHPTLFLRKKVFDEFGAYDTKYRISADYDAVLRWFGEGNLKAHYLNEVLVKMRVGGESNRSLSNIIQKSREDYRALRSNKVGGVGALAWKNFSKIGQLF